MSLLYMAIALSSAPWAVPIANAATAFKSGAVKELHKLVEALAFDTYEVCLGDPHFIEGTFSCVRAS